MPLARYPKNTRPAYTLGTSRTNTSPSYPRVLGSRPNWDYKPPHLSPGLSAVQGPPVAEPPNLMPPRSACLPLDTKHSKENTKLHSPVGHTPGENPKVHIFAIRITNEGIKLTSITTISYIVFNTTSEYNIYYYNSGIKSNYQSYE